jgi:hypothetical protein
VRANARCREDEVVRRAACWCKIGTEGGHQSPQYSSPLKGQEPKSPFGGLHLLPLLLALLLLQLLSKN